MLTVSVALEHEIVSMAWPSEPVRQLFAVEFGRVIASQLSFKMLRDPLLKRSRGERAQAL
jgi:hypothetical protein